MSIGMILLAVFDLLFLAAYCWFYKPKTFYGGFPAELWKEPEQMERTQGKKAQTEVVAE